MEELGNIETHIVIRLATFSGERTGAGEVDRPMDLWKKETKRESSQQGGRKPMMAA